MIRRFPVFLGIFVLGLDLLSKYLVQQSLPLMYYAGPLYPYGGIGVFKHFLGVEFSIVHATNRGAAWGMFSEWQMALLALRIIMVIALLIYALFYNKKPILNIPLSLIIAGAAGNVFDFFLYGHVIDMFHFILWNYDYPVFNVADSAIFIGITWFILDSLKEQDKTLKRSL